MATELNGFDWADLEDEEIEIAHDFEIDLNCVITANHSLTMEGIERTEDKALEDIYEVSGIENRETLDSIAGYAQTFYDDLRRAARLLALVGLVTRVQHWISRFANQRRHKVNTLRSSKRKRAKVRKSKLVKELDSLNDVLGAGPVPLIFFENLVTLRDAVIHGDSQVEWKHDGQIRAVADEYRSAFGADLSEEQLQEAIQKAIQQVKWCDEKMRAKSTTRPSNPGRLASPHIGKTAFPR